MSRTYRRKKYRPDWVTKESKEFEDRNTGVLFWVWRVEVQDPIERQKLINWWHYDEVRQHWYNPNKFFRKWVETRHRMECKLELKRYDKNEDYEIMSLQKKKLPWWD